MFSAKTLLEFLYLVDLQSSFIYKNTKKHCCNFATNLSTHVVLFRDKMGRNTYHNNYILNYTSREIVSKNIN